MPKPPSPLTPSLAAAAAIAEDVVPALVSPALKVEAELDVAVSAARPLA